MTERIVRLRIGAGLALVLWLACPRMSAQSSRRASNANNPNNAVISPEVLPDHRVTFRIYAPKAGEVSITGDWIAQGRGSGGKLEKDDKGVWSITVGPIEPDLYAYSFNVDGVKTIDPKNALIKPGISSVNSMVEVPGEEAAFESAQPVPHGEVRIAWYQSTALGTLRSMRVYTPPGYESGTARYPVLYLLHGSGDEDSGWSTIGRANFILDNLLAAKKAAPMIVVMPNGSMPRPVNAPTGPGNLSALERFTDELLKNVMPYVEKHYRVADGRENRAIAGLSMGGGQTLAVAPANLDRFAYIGVFSAGLFQQSTEEYVKTNAGFFQNPEKTNQMVKLFWIGVGAKDTLVSASSQKLVEALKAHGIKHEFHESEGAHTWINWRHYLNDYAQLLFR